MSVLLSMVLCFSLITAMPVFANDETQITPSSTMKSFDGFTNVPDFGLCFNVKYTSKTMTIAHIVDTYCYSLKDLPSDFVSTYAAMTEEKGFSCKYKSVIDDSPILYYYANDNTKVSVIIVIKGNEVMVTINKRR